MSGHDVPPAGLTSALALGPRLAREVLVPMKNAFVGKDEIIDLLGVCLVGRENLFLLGPPGTAKSAIVAELGRRLDGRTFEYLLTRFTEPGELFGPFDIRRLREGELVTNTEGMLPEAALIFLDELLNANSAILNSLLGVLNERIFRRGRETRPLPAIMVVGASNRLPEDDALGALFDRFLLRVRCDNVPGERLGEVLDAGWRLDIGTARAPSPTFGVDGVRRLHELVAAVELGGVRPAFIDLVGRLRHAGIPVSDRRAVKLQRLIAGSAILCGRLGAAVSDLWIVRHIWDTDEQREVIAGIVDAALARAPEEPAAHPRARRADAPDPDELGRELALIEERCAAAAGSERAVLRDRLGALAGRCQWVKEEHARAALDARVGRLWPALEGAD